MAVLSDSQIRSVVQAYFGDLGPSVVDMMVKIAKLESSGNTAAIGDNYASGHQSATSPARYDYGLFQINSQHGFDPRRLTSDLNYNVAAARKIYDLQGPDAWSTYELVTGGATGSTPMASEEEKKRATAIFNQFFGTNSLMGTADVNRIQTQILGMVEQGLSDQDILNVLVQANPNLVAAQNQQADRTAQQAGANLTVTGGGIGGFTQPGQTVGPTQGGATTLSGALQAGGYFETAPGSGVWVRPGDGLITATDVVDLSEAAAGDNVYSIGGQLWRVNPDGSATMIADSAGAAAPTFGFEVGPGGEVFRTNSQGGFESLGTFPGLANQPNLQFVTDETTGDLWAVNPQTGARQRIGNFGFASIDPERTFAEQQRQFNVEQTGLNDRARLGSATAGFQSVNQLAPQLGQLALGNAEFTRDVLRNPSDFLARAFFQRGGESPLPVVSQADIINQLRQNISGFNDVLAGFNTAPLNNAFTPPTSGFPSAPAAAPTTAVAPTAPPPPAGPPQSPSTIRAGLAAGPGGGDFSTGGNSFFIDEGGTLRVRGLEKGGFTTEPLFMVGEGGDGSAAEIVMNPDRAKIGVVPLNDKKKVKKAQSEGMPGFATGTMQGTEAGITGFLRGGRGAGPYATGGNDFFIDQSGTLQTGGVQPPVPQAAPVPASPGFTFTPTSTPAPAPTGMGFQAPQLPNQAAVTQDELVALAQQNSPPAVSSLFNGEMPSDLRFGFSLFSPQQLNALTPAEKEALNTRLGVEFNTTLEDVEHSVRQRFNNLRAQPRARFAVGF